MNILSLTYLGNIQWFSKLCTGPCIIDIHEHYIKQSYRTRCDILTANGPTSLIVNTVKESNYNKVSVKDTRIDYSKRWQHQHWQSIMSAYRNSPYFDYYFDAFEPFYRRNFDFLVDLNIGLLETALGLLKADVALNFSESYIEPDSSTERGHTCGDFRNTISPKPRLMQPDSAFEPTAYWQVFSEKMDFVPNLSIIDLLMCEGPQSLEIIKSSVR